MACVFTKRFLRSENAGFPTHRVESLRNDVAYPLLSRDAQKSFRKNSDSPAQLVREQ
jgi:hypothetical protein